ncbi:MAG: hypothetical protein H6708_33120 [Kofleriaceae bacterium]|nr:hypothetical protein [Kofleriaceae bacterium]
MAKDRAAPFSRKHRRYWIPVTGGMILIGLINLAVGFYVWSGRPRVHGAQRPPQPPPRLKGFAPEPHAATTVVPPATRGRGRAGRGRAGRGRAGRCRHPRRRAAARRVSGVRPAPLTPR